LIASAVFVGHAATSLPRSTPEAQGVSSSALLEWVQALDRQIEGMHSVMIVRHERVIAEGWWAPYAAEHRHVLYSLSKSFTSTAVGQYCVVMPDQDAVIAITSGIRDMQAVLNLIWDQFLPACGPRKLRSDPAALTGLRESLAQLEVTSAPGASTSDWAPKAMNRRFVFPENPQKIDSLRIGVAEPGKGVCLLLHSEGREMRLPAGHRQWLKGRAPLTGGSLSQFPDEPVASTFGWTAPDTLEIKVCAYETPFHTIWRLKFEGDQVTLDREANVSFGPRKQPTLIGRTGAGDSRR